jgi:hypothetical protein
MSNSCYTAQSSRSAKQEISILSSEFRMQENKRPGMGGGAKWPAFLPQRRMHDPHLRSTLLPKLLSEN